jgi:hypothetical protein
LKNSNIEHIDIDDKEDMGIGEFDESMPCRSSREVMMSVIIMMGL